jgi:DnaJ like chaperone protein
MGAGKENGGFAGALRRAIDGAASSDRPERLEPTFEILFQLLGHLARVDGRVSEEESALVRGMVEQSKLSPALRERALAAYAAAGAGSLDLDEELGRYLEAFPPGSEEAAWLFEQLLHLAMADGRVDEAERAFLDQLAKRFEIAPPYLEHRLQAMRNPSLH